MKSPGYSRNRDWGACGASCRDPGDRRSSHRDPRDRSAWGASLRDPGDRRSSHRDPGDTSEMLLTGVLIRLRADNLAIGVSPVGEIRLRLLRSMAGCPNGDLEVIKKEKTNCSKNFIERSQ